MFDDVDLPSLLRALSFETELDHITYVATAVYYERYLGGMPEGGVSMREPEDEAFSGLLGETMMALRDLEDAGKLTISHTGERYEIKPHKSLL